MSIFESFRRFFGIRPPNNNLPEAPRNYQDDSNDEDENFGFNIFSNPLEMQRYFEREMENIMKSFGLPNSFFGTFDVEVQQPEHGQRTLREQYLKPGFQQKFNQQQNKDTDVDGRLDVGQIESLLKDDESNRQVTPYVQKPIVKFFGQSMSTTTISRPDGSIETRHTVTDKDGNKETTVMHRRGDKEYTITTKINKDGKQEIIENLVNMDENEARQLISNRKDDDNAFGPHNNNWSFFDKYFK